MRFQRLAEWQWLFVTAQGLIAGAAALVEQGWSQGADARDSTGCPTEPENSDARSWSILGALVASLDEQEAQTGKSAIQALATACARLADQIDVGSLEAWNDDPLRTKADVTRLLATVAFEASGRPEPRR